MTSKRKRHGAEFKARIAIEAIKGIKTVHEIAAENNLHPTQVSQWKVQLVEKAGGAFEKAGCRNAEEAQAARHTDALERKVGQMTIEVDWLKKKCVQLGIEI